MIDKVQLYKDYANAEPKDCCFLLPNFYNYSIPRQGSLRYFQFLSLLKLLEFRGQFNQERLALFVS